MVSQLRGRRMPRNNLIIILIIIVNIEDNLKPFLKWSNEHINISAKTLGRLEDMEDGHCFFHIGLQSPDSHRRHKSREECEQLMHQEEASKKAR